MEAVREYDKSGIGSCIWNMVREQGCHQRINLESQLQIVLFENVTKYITYTQSNNFGKHIFEHAQLSREAIPKNIQFYTF